MWIAPAVLTCGLFTFLLLWLEVNFLALIERFFYFWIVIFKQPSR